MKLNTTLTAWGLLATLTVGGVAPTLADGYRDQSGVQADKNNMRNLAIGSAAVAAYGLFSHNNTATLLGAAGAVLAGSQYEKDSRRQSQDNRYDYRDGRGWNNGRQGGDNWNNGRQGSSNWGNNRDSGNWGGGYQDNSNRDADSHGNRWNRNGQDHDFDRDR